MSESDIYDFLSRTACQFKRYDHDPVYTSEQANQIAPYIPGIPTKNLFLRDKKETRYFLLIFDDKKTPDLKKLALILETSRLSLASEERLMQYLGVEPGAVSLLAIVNDPDHKVEVVIDGTLWQAEALQCHPLVNTSTLVITLANIKKFLQATGHVTKLIELKG